jgi:hypothetical protein
MKRQATMIICLKDQWLVVNPPELNINPKESKGGAMTQ